MNQSEIEYHPDDDDNMRAMRRAAAVLNFGPFTKSPIKTVPDQTYLIRCGDFVGLCSRLVPPHPTPKRRKGRRPPKETAARIGPYSACRPRTRITEGAS